MKTKKLPFKEFKSIYSQVPRLCVELIIKNKQGILLTKRNIEPLRGKWHIPGGTILMGENTEQAVKRISWEELGIKVEVKKLLGVVEYKIDKYFSQPIGLAFLVKAIQPQNIHLDPQASQFKFFKRIPKNAVKEQRLFLNKQLIKKM